MRRVASAAITAYQKAARPFLPALCRFHPSCSDYAKEAIERRGWRGLLPALGRILRCHPFNPGGYDPLNG